MRLAQSQPGLVRAAVLNDIGPSINLSGLLGIKRYVGKLPPLGSMADAVGLMRLTAGATFSSVSPEEWEIYARHTFVLKDGRIGLRYDPELAHTLDEVTPDMAPYDFWEAFEALARGPVLDAARRKLRPLDARNPRQRWRGARPAWSNISWRGRATPLCCWTRRRLAASWSSSGASRKPSRNRLRPKADADRAPSRASARRAHECRSASSKYRRGRAVPARRADRRRFAANGWRRRGAAHAG